MASIDLTSNARPVTTTVDAIDEQGRTIPTPIAGEHPLTLYLDRRELVTLMTLGAAPEHLALGWLRNQRIVRTPDQIASIQVDWDTASVAITSRTQVDFGRSIWEQSEAAGLDARLGQRTVTTGCGQGTVFGDLMDEIDSIRLRDDVMLTESTVYQVMELARSQESIYKLAGAVHGCALFTNPQATAATESNPQLLSFVEDVGRHNAVDAIAGRMWIDGTDGCDKIFYTTGRLTSEMVIKCGQMGIPILLSRSGLTGMGHEIATRLGMTLIGRCQGRHYLLFSGAHRFIARPQPA